MLWFIALKPTRPATGRNGGAKCVTRAWFVTEMAGLPARAGQSHYERDTVASGVIAAVSRPCGRPAWRGDASMRSSRLPALLAAGFALAAMTATTPGPARASPRAALQTSLGATIGPDTSRGRAKLVASDGG